MKAATADVTVPPIRRDSVENHDPRLAHLTKHVRFILTRDANGCAGYYGQPVYLVGSSLRPENRFPRDYDLRIRLPDEDFALRYGGSGEDWHYQGITGDWQEVRWRWSDDCVKQSKRSSLELQHAVDVQVYPAMYWERFDGLPRVRLDTRGVFAGSIVADR